MIRMLSTIPSRSSLFSTMEPLTIKFVCLYTWVYHNTIVQSNDPCPSHVHWKPQAWGTGAAERSYYHHFKAVLQTSQTKLCSKKKKKKEEAEYKTCSFAFPTKMVWHNCSPFCAVSLQRYHLNIRLVKTNLVWELNTVFIYTILTRIWLKTWIPQIPTFRITTLIYMWQMQIENRKQAYTGRTCKPKSRKKRRKIQDQLAARLQNNKVWVLMQCMKSAGFNCTS